MLTVSPSPGRNAGFRPLSLRARGIFYSAGERMSLIGWLFLAMLWAAISVEFCLWICPRLFRFTAEDNDE